MEGGEGAHVEVVEGRDQVHSSRAWPSIGKKEDSNATHAYEIMRGFKVSIAAHFPTAGFDKSYTSSYESTTF